jgi:NADH-quinone oxidoreductase subunit J
MLITLLAQAGESFGLPVILGLPIILGAVGYLMAVASPRRRRSVPALVGLLSAAICGWAFWWTPGQPAVEGALFVTFAALMLISGCGMQVEANPVYAALWFALVILSTCGLFLLQGAAFVSAATIIVYAGAIVVTFLFVIMLARQTGSSVYDRRFRNPVLSIALAGLLLATLVYAFQQDPPDKSVSLQGVAAGVSAPTAADQDTVTVLGRSLFVDHLWSVEIAGVLLLIATFGAILISLDTREGAP